MKNNIKYIGKMLMHPETKQIMTEDYFHLLIKLDLVPFCDWKSMDFVVLEDCKEIISEDKATLVGLINGKQIEVIQSLENYIKKEFFVYQETEEEKEDKEVTRLVTEKELDNHFKPATETTVQGSTIMLKEFTNYMIILNLTNTVTVDYDNEVFSQDEMVQLITSILDSMKIDYDTRKNDDQTISIDLYE
ncbi:hypothetical protein [Brevibacillus laterosporus]|uniref:hypothetical protein n=1 Tax=Brevibacillus laterosporus TaxID=1465 RepID=UPI0018F89EA6|nr:hypothetical protein [Brevibacillus laterosporus]MBG9776179.1 hypothetical protein [Brevibacillus laterosporus]